MDKLEQALNHEIVHNDVTFKFKKPTVMQTIKIDVLAAQYRENVPPESLSYAGRISDYLATLYVLCVSPKDYDFSALELEEIVSLYNDVTVWLRSFRKNVE